MMNNNSMSHYVLEINEAEQEEHIINWKDEANAIINDIKMHVASINISQVLLNSESNIFLNIRTIENSTYCIHVSNKGFRIVSEMFDTIDDDKKLIDDNSVIYETPQSLLGQISPQYIRSFGNALCKELRSLQEMRTELNEEDEEDF